MTATAAARTRQQHPAAARVAAGTTCPCLLLLVLALTVALLSHTAQAFVPPSPLQRRSPTTPSRVRMGTDPSSSSSHQTAAAAKRALATASALLLGNTGGLGLGPAPLAPFPPAAQAAVDMSGLPSEVQEAFKTMRNTEDPFLLRDAIKQLSEFPGLDELAFDDPARRAVNTELKALQREKPEMWEAETSYYGGVVRRAVNPFHVIEVIPLLKVGPFIGGLGYVVAILVQRKFPRLFAFAYFGAIAALVGPAVFLILNT